MRKKLIAIVEEKNTYECVGKEDGTQFKKSHKSANKKKRKSVEKEEHEQKRSSVIWKWLAN